MYKHKLRKYITKCNGESEIAARSAPGKSGLFNPREENPRHLLCYIVTRKLRFYKHARRETQPQRRAPFISSVLHVSNASLSAPRSVILKTLRTVPEIPVETVYKSGGAYNILSERRHAAVLWLRKSKQPRGTGFFMFQRLRRTSLARFINPKSSQYPRRSFLRCRVPRSNDERGRESERDGGAARKFRARVGRELGFELLYINITSGDPAALPCKPRRTPHLEGWKRGKKVDRTRAACCAIVNTLHISRTIRQPSDLRGTFSTARALSLHPSAAYRRFAISRNRLYEGAGWNGLSSHVYTHPRSYVLPRTRNIAGFSFDSFRFVKSPNVARFCPAIYFIAIQSWPANDARVYLPPPRLFFPPFSFLFPILPPTPAAPGARENQLQNFYRI